LSCPARAEIGINGVKPRSDFAKIRLSPKEMYERTFDRVTSSQVCLPAQCSVHVLTHPISIATSLMLCIQGHSCDYCFSMQIISYIEHHKRAKPQFLELPALMNKPSALSSSEYLVGLMFSCIDDDGGGFVDADELTAVVEADQASDEETEKDTKNRMNVSQLAAKLEQQLVDEVRPTPSSVPILVYLRATRALQTFFSCAT
jgi:hypothetical protein